MISFSPCNGAVEPSTSLHYDDDASDWEEYTEEIERLEEDDSGVRSSFKQRFLRKSDPDHRWEREQEHLKQRQPKDENDSLGSPSNNKENHPKCSGRRQLKRSASVDGSGCIHDDNMIKRHTWDGSSPVKGKPDFRWDKLDFDKLCNDEEPQPASPSQNKSPFASPGRIRKPPRRCKSDLGGLDKDTERPLLARTNSRVRFCLADNVCFEVPRTPKEQKQNLFYTKREIKVFKAEKKEEKKEKKEQRREEKERQKAEQQAIMDKMKAKASKSTFTPARAPAITSAC
jgi:hypothetical protein